MARHVGLYMDDLGVLLTLLCKPALSEIEIPHDAVSRILDSACRVYHIVEQVPSKPVSAFATVGQPLPRGMVLLASPQFSGLPEREEPVPRKMSPLKPSGVALRWFIRIV
ncbi:MAG: hypothetical protein JOZ17_02370 [Acetobacteraceae bacterium]|nr:hypothetical protein [Acetobacteraceae bacterium]